MKPASTLFLKTVLVLIELVVLALCVLTFRSVWVGAEQELPQYTHFIYPGLMGIYGAFIPFSIALYQAFRLLQYIDRNSAFSELSTGALRNIKYSAIAMSMLYATAMPMVAVFAEYDDAPGLVLFGLAFVCAPLIVATFAAVLQKLVQNAIDLKSENDLTI